MRKYAYGLDQEWKRTFELLRKKKRIPVDPPEFWGWKRTFKVRTDLERSWRGPLLQGILNKINTVWYSKDKNFHQLTDECGGWTYVPFDKEKKQTVHHLCEDEYKELSEIEKSYFYVDETEHSMYPGGFPRWVYVRCHFRWPWMFELVTSKHYITERYEGYPEEQSIHDLVTHKLFNEGLFYKYVMEYSDSYYKYRRQNRKKDRRELRKIQMQYGC